MGSGMGKAWLLNPKDCPEHWNAWQHVYSVREGVSPLLEKQNYCSITLDSIA